MIITDARRKEIGAALKIIIRQHGLTQLEASKLFNMSQPFVSEMLSGKKNPLLLVNKVVETFDDVTMDDIIPEFSTSPVNNMSAGAKTALLAQLGGLYDKHTELLRQAQDVFMEICILNKKLKEENETSENE